MFLNKGLTLIEVLFVIIILGILIIPITLRITGVTNEANKSALLATADSLKKSIDIHINENGQMPKESDTKLNFNKSSVEFELNENYEVEGLNSFKQSDKTYTIYLYQLNGNEDRSNEYIKITESKVIVLTQ